MANATPLGSLVVRAASVASHRPPQSGGIGRSFSGPNRRFDPKAWYQGIVASANTITTARLEIRPVVESDRRKYVDLFMDSDFMLYSATGSLDRQSANSRFEHMMTFSRRIAFGKQAIIETSTASPIGYVGADEFEFGGKSRLEFGYRLVRASRGFGYATESAGAIFELASQVWHGELLAFIDPHNGASRHVLVKTGFEFAEHIVIDGDAAELYCRWI
jgi:RimJ/RimL family protein N-acetyltransferase